MNRYDIAIIGGGASGITAAISAGRKGAAVVICEKMPLLGKKILASGNGRCNLLNDDLSDLHYNAASRPLVKSVFSRFGKGPILDFFNGLGLRTYSDNGRIFPATDQSQSVLKVMEMELKTLSVSVELNFEAIDINHTENGGFVVASKNGGKIECGKLILAGGGKSYPALGSDGRAYKFARQFAHTIIEPVPSAVPVTAKDRICHILQGQKIAAKVTSLVNGETLVPAEGDLLFTKYGLSGAAILDISRDISIAINRERINEVEVSIDLVPFMETGILEEELARRLKKGYIAEELTIGILPNKFGQVFKDIFKDKDAPAAARKLKTMRFKITGTRGWNEAEFTAGGVKTDEIKSGALESKFKSGLYFAGEIIDVDGRRGGYNLAWAWASGYVAGEEAARGTFQNRFNFNQGVSLK